MNITKYIKTQSMNYCLFWLNIKSIFIILVSISGCMTSYTKKDMQSGMNKLVSIAEEIKKEGLEILDNENNEKCINYSKQQINNAILFLGSLGSGKSTTINYLLKNDLKKILITPNNENSLEDEEFDEDEKTSERYIIDIDKIENKKYPKIGHTCIAETIYPCPYYSDEYDLTFCDCPGFFDNRGKSKEILVTILNNLLLKSCKEIRKICFLIEYDSFIAERGRPFIRGVIEILESIFSQSDINDGDPMASVIFLITKNNNLTRREIRDTIKSFKNGFEAGIKENQAEFSKYVDYLERILKYKSFFKINPLDDGKCRTKIIKQILLKEIKVKEELIKIPEYIEKSKLKFVGSENIKAKLESIVKNAKLEIQKDFVDLKNSPITLFETKNKLHDLENTISEKTENLIKLLDLPRTGVNSLILKSGYHQNCFFIKTGVTPVKLKENKPLEDKKDTSLKGEFLEDKQKKSSENEKEDLYNIKSDNIKLLESEILKLKNESEKLNDKLLAIKSNGKKSKENIEKSIKNIDFLFLLEDILNLNSNYFKKIYHTYLAFNAYENNKYELIKKENIHNIEEWYDEKGYNLIHKACIDNKIEILKLLVDKENCYSSSLDLVGQTPLHLASMAGSIDMIKLLSEKGCNIDIMNKIGTTALDISFDNSNLELMMTLLRLGADPNLFTFEKSETLLHKACKKNNYKYAETLLQNGANVDIQGIDEWGYTPLHWAAQEGNDKIIKLLKSHNAKMDKLDKKGCSTLERAYENDKFETMKTLINCGADPNIFVGNDRRYSLLHEACVNNKYKHAEVLLQNGANVDIQTIDEWGSTPLHWAAEKGNNDIIRLLTKYNAKINKLDKKGYSVLERAYGNDKFETIKVLINCGADPNTTSRGKIYTLLHSACQHNKFRHAEVLLQNGANVNIPSRNEWGYTPTALGSSRRL